MLLSLDLGFINTGYVLVSSRGLEDYGVISTQKTTNKQGRVADDNLDRCSSIAVNLNKIVVNYGVLGVMGELPSGGAQSARAAAAMSLVTGCLGACVAILNLPCEWCTPTQTKMALCGTKTASKQDMMEKATKVTGGNFEKVGNGVQYWMRLWSGKKGPIMYGASFEHVADALGAYMALENGMLVKVMKTQTLSGERRCLSEKRSKSSKELPPRRPQRTKPRS